MPANDTRPGPTPLLGTKPKPGDHPLGYYTVNRCSDCDDIHLAIATRMARPYQDRSTLAQVQMSTAEARQLAAELLAFAEGN